MFCAWSSVIIGILFPFIMLFLIIKRRKDPNFKDQFGVIVDKANVKDISKSLLNVFFVVRRIIFIILAFFFSDPVF